MKLFSRFHSPSMVKSAVDDLFLATTEYWASSSAQISLMISLCTLPSAITWWRLVSLSGRPFFIHSTWLKAIVSSHSSLTVAGSSLTSMFSRGRTNSSGSSAIVRKSTHRRMNTPTRLRSSDSHYCVYLRPIHLLRLYLQSIVHKHRTAEAGDPFSFRHFRCYRLKCFVDDIHIGEIVSTTYS